MACIVFLCHVGDHKANKEPQQQWVSIPVADDSGNRSFLPHRLTGSWAYSLEVCISFLPRCRSDSSGGSVCHCIGVTDGNRVYIHAALFNEWQTETKE